MNKQRQHYQGFTLVEAIVVVTIIAILLGILLPSLASARAQSKVVACMANLKSMGELTATYAEENDNRLPRGPSFYQPGSTFSPYIATNALWIGFPIDPNTPEYVGAGLLTRAPGRVGNETHFCPADDKRDIVEESPKIGMLGPGVLAYSSYFFRQLDLLPPTVSGENTPNPELQQPGRLDDLGSNLGYRTAADAGSSLQVAVHALALDANTLGTTAFTRRSNHKNRKANVVYTDGAVNSFDNNDQRLVDSGGGDPDYRPWASVDRSAFTTSSPYYDFDALVQELDRILMASDYSYLGDPWKAPVPWGP